MPILRAGLVGCGHNGLAHARCYQRDARTELAAVCDLNEERRNRAAADLGATAYPTVAAMLEAADLDIVTVNTSDPFHVEPFVEACRAGCHVFVEKPMADSIAGLEAMVEAARANSGRQTLVGHILRFNPFFARVKELCESGALGELFYLEADYIHSLFVQAAAERFNPALGMNWYTAREQPCIGGGIHPFDLLRWFAGANAVEVAGFDNRIAFPEMQCPDCQVFLARFETGAVAKVASAYGPVGPRPPVNHLSVYGTRGTVRDTDLWLGEGHDAEHQSLAELPLEGHPYEPEVDHFLTCILQDRPTISDAVDGANSAAACVRGAEAARLGKTLSVPQFAW
ncbi:MAG: Gfo/Idh/MocA family oxidoreductase [Armatimonadetes bacterium]|nr:Gfo/Idh/MocA family oxidoreductase [Armatimonadota bacterium]